MQKWEVVKVERAGKNAYKVVILCEGLEISFIPQVTVKKLKESKNAKETNRIYLYGGELNPEKMKLHPSVEKAIKQQAWAIFFGSKKKSLNKISIPNEKRMIQEAMEINKSIKTLKVESPSRTWTKLLEAILRSRAEPLIFSSYDFENLNPTKKEVYFNLNKVKIKVTKEGWFIIYRHENGKTYKNVVFDIDSVIRMQEHILDSYLSSADDLCGEISKINELKKLSKEINHLLIDWTNTKKNKNKLREKILSLIERLSSYRNKCKTDSKDLLESISSLKDSRAKENPPAFAAKMIAVINKLEHRLKDIFSITTIIENRKELLKKYNEVINTRVLCTIKDLDKFINIRNFSYYTNINKIKIGRILYLLDSVSFEPYLSKKTQASFYLEAAKDSILETRKAKKYLRTALSILQS